MNTQNESKASRESINLKNNLKNKIEEQKLKRSSNIKKELIVDKNFKKLGIDKQKFKDDLEALKKQGGFSDEQIQKLMNSMAGK
jgi:hypothetical protein